MDSAAAREAEQMRLKLRLVDQGGSLRSVSSLAALAAGRSSLAEGPLPIRGARGKVPG